MGGLPGLQMLTIDRLRRYKLFMPAFLGRGIPEKDTGSTVALSLSPGGWKRGDVHDSLSTCLSQMYHMQLRRSRSLLSDTVAERAELTVRQACSSME